ncbi:MAG: hypothetical protein Q8R26_02335 [bacterium]|nr:hypothetical protein [bacterium]
MKRQKIVSSQKKILEAIAKNLIEKETLELEQEVFYALIKSFKLKPVSV